MLWRFPDLIPMYPPLVNLKLLVMIIPLASTIVMFTRLIPQVTRLSDYQTSLLTLLFSGPQQNYQPVQNAQYPPFQRLDNNNMQPPSKKPAITNKPPSHAMSRNIDKQYPPQSTAVFSGLAHDVNYSPVPAVQNVQNHLQKYQPKPVQGAISKTQDNIQNTWRGTAEAMEYLGFTVENLKSDIAQVQVGLISLLSRCVNWIVVDIA